MNYCLVLVLAGELCSLTHSVNALHMTKTKSADMAMPIEQSMTFLKDPSKWVIACSKNQKIFMGTVTATLLVSLMIYYRKHGLAKMLNFWDWVRHANLTQLDLDHTFYKAVAESRFDGLKGAEMWWLRGADVNGHMQGDYPLHIAAYNGDEKLVRWLVNHKAAINATDNTGQTPLMRSAANPTEHTRDIVYFLKNKGAQLTTHDTRQENVLTKAVLHPNVYTESFIDDLITRENINAQDSAGETPLMKTLAIPDPYKAHDKKLITRLAINLIHKNADIHLACANGETALQRAVRFDYTDVAKALLNNFGSQKKDIAELEKALQYAVEYGKYELIDPIKQELYGQTGGRNYEREIFSWAIAIPDPVLSLKTLDALLSQREGSLTIEVLNGALSEALKKNRLEHVQKVLRAGAVIDIKNKKGQTPLMVAIILGFTDIALEFLKHPVIGDRMHHGLALQIQAQEDNVIQLQSQPFLNMINQQDVHGYTALHYAVERNSPPVVEALLKAGADKNFVTKDTQQTPYDLAKSNHFETVENIFSALVSTNSYQYNWMRPF